MNPPTVKAPRGHRAGRPGSTRGSQRAAGAAQGSGGGRWRARSRSRPQPGTRQLARFPGRRRRGAGSAGTDRPGATRASADSRGTGVHSGITLPLARPGPRVHATRDAGGGHLRPTGPTGAARAWNALPKTLARRLPIPRVPSALPFPNRAAAAWPRWGFLAAACAHPPPRPLRPGNGPAARPGPRPSSRGPPSPTRSPPRPRPAPPPPTGAALAALRADADAVLRAQGETYWRLFTEGNAGDPAAAWRGRDDAPLRSLAGDRRAARDGGTEDRRPASYLAAWLRRASGWRATRADALRDTARAREQARLTWSDHDVLLRVVPSLLAGEQDRERRRALSEAAAAAASGLVPFAERAEQRLVAVARDLGYPSPVALAAELRGAAGARPGGAGRGRARAHGAHLAGAAREDGARPRGCRAERGAGPVTCRACSAPRCRRGSSRPAATSPWARAFSRAWASIWPGRRTCGSRPGPHPGTPPHSIALPVDPPGDVRLAVAALAGLDASRAVLHELGAAEYYAHLPRRPGRAAAARAPPPFPRPGPCSSRR